MSEEHFDIVNDRDEVIGLERRSEIHCRHLKHRAVHVLVFNDAGELFLQKRSMRKDCFPGVWDSSASGHLDSGETYDQCAVREVQEELGLNLAEPPKRLFKIDACAETGWEFIWIYHAHAEGPFDLNRDEIDEGAWFTPGHIDRWLKERPEDFAGSVPLIWQQFWSSRQRPSPSEARS